MAWRSVFVLRIFVRFPSLIKITREVCESSNIPVFPVVPHGPRSLVKLRNIRLHWFYKYCQGRVRKKKKKINLFFNLARKEAKRKGGRRKKRDLPQLQQEALSAAG